MNLPHRPLSTARGQGRGCKRGRGWQRDIYLHAPLSTAGRDNPQINMTFLQAQTCVHMGRRSGRVPPCSLFLTHFVSLNQSKLIAQQAGAVKTRGGAHWTVMDMGQKVKHLSSICGCRTGADRSEQVARPSPSLCPVPVHKFNYSKSSPNVAASKKPLAQVDPPTPSHSQ